MKITVFAAGSRGDIQPCIALAKGLQEAGHRVHLAAPAAFAALAEEHGVGFYPLRGDVQEVMASETGREFMETGAGNPIKSIRAIRTLVAPIVMDMVDDAYAACEDADALICLGVFSSFGHAIAQALGIPMLNVEPTPLLPTRAFPAPSWPIQRNLGGLHNAVSGRLMLLVLLYWYRPFVRDVRHRFGLTTRAADRLYRVLRSTPMIGAYSPSVIPHPADWPDSVHVTGYLFLDPLADWQPPSGLQAFLDAGDPPVYVGFGSMAGRDPEHLARLVVGALEESDQRGILLTGWGGMRAELHSERVYVVDAAPHGWLFPRVAAVVHHGGAGTTAEGLRAGKPTAIVPFALDQPFWGARVRAMGVGPTPVLQKHLTVDRLARAIEAAVTDPDIKRRAEACGAAIRSEDGVGGAVDVVRRYLG